MEHAFFKPKSLNEGKNAVVGNCNAITMEERYEKETPVFAQAILKQSQLENPRILDYGCGVGRLAKEIRTQKPQSFVWGVDASEDMINLAIENTVDMGGVLFSKPNNLLDSDEKFDIAYLVYVLQHVPSVEIRDVLARIHHCLSDDGVFVYCSSDYRMAIRFDQGGFFDDRFLGVNLREEISRFFVEVGPLFDNETLEANPVVKTMVLGGLPHPAFIYKKKEVKHYFNTTLEEVAEIEVIPEPQEPQVERDVKDAKKLLLVNRLSPGDILVMTNAVRDLALSHPNKYEIDVRTPCDDIFKNNPYITKLYYNESEYSEALKTFAKVSSGDMTPSKHKAWLGDILVIDMHYPLINTSGKRGSHFGEGHTDFLEKVLEIKITPTALTPELYLDGNEKNWVSPLILKKGIKENYWVINAGIKSDYTLKQYPRFQEVVNLLKDKIKFVQIGIKGHLHKPLDNVIDMVGETNTRELMRLIYHAEGVITCVSFPMHIAAALNKPCVVVAGAREGTRWELYPNHQFLYVNGCLPCATYDGCWKSKDKECSNKVDEIAKCMTLITPEDVARSVSRYYDGGMLTY